MCELNRDILYSIFEILKDDKKNFPSCLLVNKTWYVKYLFQFYGEILGNI